MSFQELTKPGLRAFVGLPARKAKPKAAESAKPAAKQAPATAKAKAQTNG